MNKKIIKSIFIVIIILFLSMYFSKYNIEYYENKKVLTDEAIKEYEKDLKEGKDILSKNYVVEEKNYNNKISKAGMKTSHFIEKAFDKGIKGLMNCLEKLQDS